MPTSLQLPQRSTADPVKLSLGERQQKHSAGWYGLPSTTTLRRLLEPAQYTSEAYEKLLGAHDVLQSVSRPGNCYDNAVAESFFATLKQDLVYRTTWPTRDEARHAIFEYIEAFYNRERRHSVLGNVSPEEFEARHHNGQAA